MEKNDDLTGQFARLPDGQKVRIESCEKRLRRSSAS